MPCAHKKTIIYGKVNIQNERPSLYWDLKILFQNVMTVLAWSYSDKKTSPPYLGEEPMKETWHLFKKDKDVLPFPSLPLIIKM